MNDDEFAELVEATNSPAAKRIAELERELATIRFAAARVEWKFGRNDDGTPKRWKEWDDVRDALGEHVRQPQELEP